MVRRIALRAAAILGIGASFLALSQAGAEQRRGCLSGAPNASGYCHTPMPRDACRQFPPACTPHSFTAGGVEYCQYKQLPCDGKPDAKQSEDKPDRFAVGIGKCDQAVAPDKRCKWDGINCYEQRTGRYAQETFEPVDFAQCRGESVQAFLDACAFWIRRGHVTTNCPTRERLAQSPYDGAKPHADAIPPAPEKAAAPPPQPAPAKCPVAIGEYAQVLAQRRDREIFKGSDHMKKADEAFEEMSRRIGANAECRQLCSQDSACAPWLEMVVQLLDEKEGTCVAVERMLAPSDAVLLLTGAEVMRKCKKHIQAAAPGPAVRVPDVRVPQPTVRTPTPTVNAPAPRTPSAAQPACPAGFSSVMRLGMEWCGAYGTSDEACRQAGGGITKDMTAAGGGRNLCLVRPAAAMAPGAPAVRAPTPPTVKAPEVRAPTPPSTAAPRTPAPTPPNTVMSGMTPRCQQLVSTYVAAARAKDGPAALAGYQALKAAGGCGVLHKVDRPQPQVRAPAPSDSRFISRGATPNTDQVVGSCDASPAECAARVRQLQAGTSDAAKAALYSHAFSVGWQLGTMIGSGVLMAVPPSAPRTASPTTAAPGVRNTYGQGSPLKPAPRTRQSDITGTK